MPYNENSDDQRPPVPRKADEFDLFTHRPDLIDEDPAYVVGVKFCTLILGYDEPDIAALRDLTTPETHRGWGDFTAARTELERLDAEGHGFGPVLRRPEYPDVAHMLFTPADGLGMVTTVRQAAAAASGAVTLVLRAGEWLVFQLGEPADPARVPRPSTATRRFGRG